MSDIIVKPAYGRDYKSGRAAAIAWHSGADFKLLNENGRIMNTYCSRRDYEPGTMVQIRFSKCERLTITRN